MKKFFLFAVAALMCTAISAQNGMKKMAAPTVVAKPAIQKMTNTTPKAAPEGTLRMAVANRSLKQFKLTPDMRLKPVSQNPAMTKKSENRSFRSLFSAQTTAPRKSVSGLKAASKVKNVNPRRAGAVLPKYTAEGISILELDENGDNEVEYVTWEMLSATMTLEDETKVDVLIDVIPTPESFKQIEGFENGIPYVYSIAEDVLTIDPQMIASGEDEDGTKFYVFLFGYSDDGPGAITMAISEDGALTPSQDFLIAAFSTEDFPADDESFDSSYMGFYEWIYNVNYTNRNIDMEYRAFGVEDGESLNWTMQRGVISGSKGTNPVFIDLIPVPEGLEDLYPNGIDVPYKQSGKSVTVEPQSVAYTQGEDGTTYTFYLCSAIDEGGAIHLTLNDDGTIEVDPEEEIMIAAFSGEEFSWDGYEGSYSDVSRIKYLAPGQKLIPEAAYEPEGVYLHVGYSPEGYGYYSNIAGIPADATVDFRNIMIDPADTFSWSVTPYGEEGLDTNATITGDTFNFAFDTQASEVYAPVELVASNEGEKSKMFRWGLNATDSDGNEIMGDDGEPYPPYVFAGYLFDDEADDGPLFVSKCNIHDDGYYIWSRYATPDKTSNSISKLVLYQGKPAGPLYFEGINLQVYKMEMNEDFHLTCKIQKVGRNAEGRLELGEVIAQSDISVNDVTTTSDGVSYLEWTSFYTEDEMGMTTDLDFLQIEDEFAIVIDGWDNGTFSCEDVMGDAYNPAATNVSTYFYVTGNDEHLYYFTSYPYLHLCVGYIGAAYGYLHTEDSTDIIFTGEGGKATLHITPMLCSVDEEETRYTQLWYADENYVEPEWLTVEIANEVYDETGFGFDLEIEAAPMTDAEYRSETLELVQAGAKLVITITQQGGEGINDATIESLRVNGKLYNLSGRQVRHGKGIVVSNGKKMILK
jgi:hypothetical protein